MNGRATAGISCSLPLGQVPLHESESKVQITKRKKLWRYRPRAPLRSIRLIRQIRSIRKKLPSRWPRSGCSSKFQAQVVRDVVGKGTPRGSRSAVERFYECDQTMALEREDKTG